MFHITLPPCQAIWQQLNLQRQSLEHKDHQDLVKMDLKMVLSDGILCLLPPMVNWAQCHLECRGWFKQVAKEDPKMTDHFCPLEIVMVRILLHMHFVHTFLSWACCIWFKLLNFTFNKPIGFGCIFMLCIMLLFKKLWRKRFWRHWQLDTDMLFDVFRIPTASISDQRKIVYACLPVSNKMCMITAFICSLFSLFFSYHSSMKIKILLPSL